MLAFTTWSLDQKKKVIRSWCNLTLLVPSWIYLVSCGVFSSLNSHVPSTFLTTFSPARDSYVFFFFYSPQYNLISFFLKKKKWNLFISDVFFPKKTKNISSTCQSLFNSFPSINSCPQTRKDPLLFSTLFSSLLSLFSLIFLYHSFSIFRIITSCFFLNFLNQNPNFLLRSIWVF